VNTCLICNNSFIITKKQSLKQIQIRDKIKRILFKDNNINVITINDYGKFNKSFVFLKFNEIIEIIINKKYSINETIL
jgi:hypothetical protein